jgi:gamma-glutamyltranspeptidase/glutathione hydrolase
VIVDRPSGAAVRAARAEWRARANGGVVAAAHPLAAEAGAALLARGGMAADAAVAAASMLSVVEPFGSGLGGGGFFLHYDAASGAVTALDGRETAPAAASADLFLHPTTGEPWPRATLATGGAAVGAPGQARCWAEALRRWGRFGLADALAPAISVAREGFAVTPYFVREARAHRQRLGACPASARAFLPGGRPPPPGWRLVQPELAATLELLARDGADAFCAALAPEIAAAVVASAGEHPPGRLSAADVADYRVQAREPVRGSYRGYTVAASAAPSSGVTVVEMLHLLERFDVRGLGPRAPAGVHLLGEALRVAHADRVRWLGDPDHGPVPCAALASRFYAAERGRYLALDGATAERIPPGLADGGPAPAVPLDEADADAASTTHLSVADTAGNAVAYTATLGTHFGAALTVPGRGFLLNNALRNFRFDPRGAVSNNLAAPGKRPRSSIAPALVFDAAGRLRWVLGAAGAAWITPLVAQLVVSLVDWGLGPQAAVDAPRAMADDTAGTLLLEPALYDGHPALVTALWAMGHPVLRAGGPRGAAQVVALDLAGGAAEGAADRRRDGAVAVCPAG